MRPGRGRASAGHGQSAGDTKHVDAPMGIEVLVLDGNDGLSQNGREVVVVDDDSLFQRERADDATLGVVQVGDSGRSVALEVVDLRQIDRKDQH